MTSFLQAAAAILIAVILCIALGKNGKETALLVSLAACSMVVICALDYLAPVMNFLNQLQDTAQMDSSVLKLLGKVVGFGMITELVVLICTDAGNAALGKALQILSSAVILWLSIPVLEDLLELVTSILGEK